MTNLSGLAQVFDEDGKNRTYGFVDYVTPEGAQMAMQQKSILMPPGQYIKVNIYRLLVLSIYSLQCSHRLASTCPKSSY